jgi:hypothetical protein
VPASEERVLFFTELRDMAGQSVKHRWTHKGEQVAEVSFDVGGPRWRVWSSKTMMPEWQGEWTVQVVDAAGEVVAEKGFSYGQVAAEAAKPVEEPAAAEESAGEAMGVAEPVSGGTTEETPQAGTAAE